jgi:hypothetical protein
VGNTHVDPSENPRESELILIAAEFIEAKRFDYATIAIQTAVEIYVERCVLQILDWRELGPLGEVITDKLLSGPYHFKDDRFKAVWRSLTRDEIQRQDWWANYLKHVERRNRIVHSGTHVSSQEAGASMLAAISLMSYVNDMMVKTGLRLGKLAEIGTAFRADPDPY